MLFLISLSLLAPLAALNLPSKGIEISFDLDVPLSNARVYVHVYAVMPNSSSIDVYRGFVYGNKLFVDEGFEGLRKAVDTWLHYRGDDTGYHTSLIIDAWIVTP